jgi:hypothetical protein
MDWKAYYGEVEARVEDAMAGPWVLRESDDCDRATVQNALLGRVGDVVNDVDGDFIAASRTDVPRLLARCRVLERALERSCESYRQIAWHHDEPADLIGEADYHIAAAEAEGGHND